MLTRKSRRCSFPMRHDFRSHVSLSQVVLAVYNLTSIHTTIGA